MTRLERIEELARRLVQEVVAGRGWANPCGEVVEALEAALALAPSAPEATPARRGCSEEGHGEYGKGCFHAAAAPDAPSPGTVRADFVLAPAATFEMVLGCWLDAKRALASSREEGRRAGIEEMEKAEEVYRESVKAVVSALAQGTAKCSTCEKPATCVGSYEAQETIGLGCDDCCGHGNEDGWCVEIVAAPDAPDAGTPATQYVAQCTWEVYRDGEFDGICGNVRPCPRHDKPSAPATPSPAEGRATDPREK